MACPTGSVPSQKFEPKAKNFWWRCRWLKKQKRIPSTKSTRNSTQNGTPEGTRTPNPRNRNPMLYPLSHWRIHLKCLSIIAEKRAFVKRENVKNLSGCAAPGEIWIYSFTNAMCTSSSCFWSTVLGAPIITSWAFLFMGKVMTSRMLSSPVSIIIRRSTPGAAPA